MRRPGPLRPDRVRHLERPFSWIPFRILTSGLLARMSPPAQLLYFFLCLVADRYGVSFYGEERLGCLIGLSGYELTRARQELCAWDLLAFDGRVYQLLSLPQPQEPPRPAPPPARHRDPSGPLKPIGQVLQRLWGES